ncbi:MAG: hypothetical protein R2705_23905 [Ilumatobacteraceae bacterium]
MIALLLAALGKGTSWGLWARRYATVAATVGIAISTWHYTVEWYPELEPANVCALDNPCTLIWFRRMGFVTIPFMAWCGFAAVLGLLFLARSKHALLSDLDDSAELDGPGESPADAARLG